MSRRSAFEKAISRHLQIRSATSLTLRQENFQTVLEFLTENKNVPLGGKPNLFCSDEWSQHEGWDDLAKDHVGLIYQNQNGDLVRNRDAPVLHDVWARGTKSEVVGVPDISFLDCAWINMANTGTRSSAVSFTTHISWRRATTSYVCAAKASWGILRHGKSTETT